MVRLIQKTPRKHFSYSEKDVVAVQSKVSSHEALSNDPPDKIVRRKSLPKQGIGKNPLLTFSVSVSGGCQRISGQFWCHA